MWYSDVKLVLRYFLGSCFFSNHLWLKPSIVLQICNVNTEYCPILCIVKEYKYLFSLVLHSVCVHLFLCNCIYCNAFINHKSIWELYNSFKTLYAKIISMTWSCGYGPFLTCASTSYERAYTVISCDAAPIRPRSYNWS